MTRCAPGPDSVASAVPDRPDPALVRAVVAGAATELLGFWPVAYASSLAGMPVLYVLLAPPRLAALSGGAVAGYLAVARLDRSSDGEPGNAGGLRRAGLAGAGYGLGVSATGLAVAALGLAALSPLWVVVAVAVLAVVAALARRRETAGRRALVAGPGGIAVLALVAPGSRRLVGGVLYLGSALPRVGAYAFFPDGRLGRGAVLLAVAVASNVVGGALGGVVAGRRD